MANTEGMSEETMASLLTPSPPTVRKKKKSAFALRQERMRQRMEEPMGERPAATVIRASPPLTRPTENLDTIDDSLVDQEENKEHEAEPPSNEPPAPPILGDIVERNVSSFKTNHQAANNGSKVSKFGSQRVGNGSTGFPSLDMPIGTFVKNGAPARVSKDASLSAVASRQEPQHDDSIQRDSEALLAQMSPDEIREEVQELKSTLSPEMISFLQKRGRQKHGKAPSKDTNSDDKRPKQQTSTTLSKSDDVQEKQRMASLLSSIRTPEELDDLYAKEIGTSLGAEDEGTVPMKDDWDTACALLRSTSPRQTLWAARVVCQRLEADAVCGKSCSILITSSTAWPYPTVLPVSLRCLLDSPVSQSNGFLLHTFALRSLYALLQLRAHRDHIVDVSCKAETTASVFQQHFMQDAVPSPPFGSCYPSMSVQPVASNNDGNGVAYATSSSSTSAQQDGQAFAKDPMWTLLTRMRVLPRIAELLSVSQLPDEAIVAICGILSMLSVRSVGTASAIAQHQTILPSLLKLTLLPPTNDDNGPRYTGFFNTRVALPTIIFFCTLARQSRIGATAIQVNSIVPPIVALKAETHDEHALQRWSLILWRTCVRYGVGLSSLSTLIPLAIPHLASGRPAQYSLSVEFLSAFSNVLYCVRIANSKPVNEWRRVMTAEDVEVLATAQDWLATTSRQSIRQVKDVSTDSNLQLAAARLLFLQSYFAASKRGSSDGGTRGDEAEDKNVDWYELVVALEQVSENSIVEKALAMIPVNGCDQSILDAGDDWVNVVSEKQEATACAFIDALASLISTISMSESPKIQEEQSQTVISPTMSKIRQLFVNWMSAGTTKPVTTASATGSQRARRGWLNATNFHVNRFVLAASLDKSDFPTTVADLEIVRSHAFSLIGRLELGEEAFAAMLFSSDELFRTKDETRSSTSPLSSFLMQELCATSLSRQQLDHSFKLHYGFGITANEWGAFEIGTLLSETDSQEARSSGPFTELLLPMGPHWLWKILSGTMNQAQSGPGAASKGDADGASILGECLELLLYLEQYESSTPNSYFAQVPNGVKLYYLMNVFLHPETVIRDDRISELVTKLFDRYTAQLRAPEKMADVLIAESFWRACLDHSRISNPKEADGMDEKDEKLLSMFMGDRNMTEKELLPLLDFVSDVCKAYLEFGGQYDSFTRCIRLFLSIEFPSRVRDEAERLLREVLHLLTLEEEEANPDDRQTANS